jgi:hypothetical protein
MDSFGLGYSYYNLSNALQGALAPMGKLDNEQGFEAYYNFVIIPGVHIAIDLQYLDPAIGANKSGFQGQGLYVSPSKDLVVVFFSTIPRYNMPGLCADDRQAEQPYPWAKS